MVAVHLSSLADAGIAPQTLALRMAAIGYAHRQAGEAIPHKVRGGTVILDILAGARREWGKPPDRKAAADGDVIWSMLHEIKGDTLKAVALSLKRRLPAVATRKNAVRGCCSTPSRRCTICARHRRHGG